jgi:ABC-type branched-subunit amino acid transport system permease subunit
MRPYLAVAALAVLVAALAAVPWLVSDYGLGFMINLMSYLVLTIAWALFSGTTRYVSLATAAFFGLGAYTVAMLIKVLPIYACFGIALALGTVMALLVGLVTLRVSGMFFVIFGFGLSELMRELLVWWEINKTHHGTLCVRAVRHHADLRAPAGARGAGVPGRMVDQAVPARRRARRDRRRRDHGAAGWHQRTAG